ncbi:cupredoxin domain-containing protein [Methylocapsa aurea]|uniref:cupredoxin domain-containing protein n=1 Tax=Methylocapsa aurea TaxID=663610 RepID=UPI00056A8678|nr:cupredoxin domain-containing protein [Methylocapsa aurea]
MLNPSISHVFLPAIASAFLILLGQSPSGAQEAVTLRTSIKNHLFQPAELKAPANTPITLIVRNLDPTPEEFESKTLRVEKVVAGNAEITLKLRPLAAGRYRFYGDFNESTAEGAIIAE